MVIYLNQVLAFLCVFARVTGSIILNPVFGRNAPSGVKIGLSFLVSVLIQSSVPFAGPANVSFPAFLLMMVKELAIGMVMGFFIQMFLAALIVAGETIDMQMGLSMAKAYDPGTNTSISMTSTMLTSMFVLVFFVTNSHLTLIRIVSLSFQAVPAGAAVLDAEIGMYVVELFSNLLLYALKISLPMIAIQLITEVGVGIIMKAIPQINVFVINIQIKIFVGFILVLTLVPAMSSVLEHMIEILFSNITQAMGYFA